MKHNTDPILFFYTGDSRDVVKFPAGVVRIDSQDARAFRADPARDPRGASTRAGSFDGETYDPARDGARLSGQLARVHAALADGKWWTLAALIERCGGTTASVSARVRDLRKPRFGGHVVKRRNAGGGLWEYRMIRYGNGGAASKGGSDERTGAATDPDGGVDSAGPCAVRGAGGVQHGGGAEAGRAPADEAGD